MSVLVSKNNVIMRLQNRKIIRTHKQFNDLLDKMYVRPSAAEKARRHGIFEKYIAPVTDKIENKEERANKVAEMRKELGIESKLVQRRRINE